MISIGAGISGFVVIWEMITGLERGAAFIESWSGKLETYDTVVDIGSRSKLKRNVSETEEGMISEE